jgi:predicted flap endonuclease-1-like 5' DNA nuclease
MEQVSQYQASNRDSRMRAKELSDSLKEAFERRDELQRQMKEIRGNLEIAVAQRNKYQADRDSNAVRGEAVAGAIREKDEKIFKLSRELETWQSRVPPLVERYRLRDLEAQQLEVELTSARERIASLENLVDSGQTRIEPVGTNAITDGLDASNDQYDETSVHDGRSLGLGAGNEAGDVTSRGNGQDHGETGLDAYLAGGTVDFDIGADDENPAAGNDDLHHRNGADGRAGIGEAAGPNDDHDDLKQIKGVGPAIEKTLNKLGICRFGQIADMSEYDIDRVARELKGFRSRIYREDWIGQARTLQYDKNNGPA